MGDYLSVIVPSFNEEEMINITANTLSNVLRKANMPHEIIFVDDGSSDSTWAKILKAEDSIPSVRGVRFSRNFGKESAIIAGLSASKGDCCVVIDCDLQHPPVKIVEMYNLWKQGYEIVEGVKSNRGEESKAHSFAAKTFYALISKATGVHLENTSDFKLLDRKAVNVLINMPERNAFFRAMSSWIGFKTTKVTFDVQEREAGTSKWNTKKLIKYALTNISSFTTAPMQIVTILGAIMLVVAIILGIVALVQKATGYALGGFTTVILIELFSASIIMISLGIIGYYIARIYEEIKGRPKYIVAETCGENNEKHD